MVSEDRQIVELPSFISTPTKIRSRYRRRLLNRLSEGGATVTSLAREIDSKFLMPLQSLENLEMRD